MIFMSLTYYNQSSEVIFELQALFPIKWKLTSLSLENKLMNPFHKESNSTSTCKLHGIWFPMISIKVSTVEPVYLIHFFNIYLENLQIRC